MEKYNIYEDISRRSGGNVYIGVVGPVRTGKSSFIAGFMEQLVLPNIENKFNKQRAIDEMPQAASGKTVMTTQPKFVPNEAVKINVDDVEMNIRLVDCVGFMIKDVLAEMEGESSRFVKTPWSEEEMPFEKAAEVGTQKVIEEHSNLAVCITTDGSFTEIDRQSYVLAEEKTVAELKKTHKPFVIVLNTNNVEAESTKTMVKSLKEKYNAPVLAIDVANLKKEDISKIMEEMISEFPVQTIDVKLPNWMSALPFENCFLQEVITEIKNATSGLEKIGDFNSKMVMFANSENYEALSDSKVVLADGTISLTINPKPQLFYKVLSYQCGTEIEDDYHLVAYLKELTFAKTEFDKIKMALDGVRESGYGIVYPNINELTLEEPQVVKQGSRYGVKLRAHAPSLHIMQVDIQTEINPLMGAEAQSEDMVRNMLSQFEENPNGIWDTNMFGKSMSSLVQEGLNGKIGSMPVDAQRKMRKTLGRIINEGKGGIICILL